MLQIPPSALSPDVLDRLVEEFVTRHGTDLAEADTKKAQVRRQLETGHALIVFDEESQTANIVEKDFKPTPPPRSEERRVESHDEPGVLEHAPPGRRREREVDDGERRIVYDEPAPPDPTE
jgi:uncharacterized protein YheU (UPF0270 family)